ncbi:MAG: hypothetical protein H0S85_05020 [Desulfovibrionaceae bacterium]|jgi:hypothetical protein|nr:hypothetical protein [Desulfovibrionaceae bacterium]
MIAFLSEAKQQKLDFAFLNQVRGHFVDMGLSPDVIDAVILVFACALALGVILYGVNLLRGRLFPPPPPVGTIENPVHMRAILTDALDQRSKVEVTLPDEGPHSVLPCALLDVDSDRLVLESVRTTLGETWVSRPVTCYFRVMGSKKNAVHYSFTTPVLSVERTGPDTLELALARPEKLEIRQKRFFLRLEPPREYVLAFALWPEKLSENGVFMENVKGWGKPELFRTPKVDGGVLLDNLSAGGMRVFVERQALKDVTIDFSKGKRLFCLLELYDPETAKKLRFFLHVRVQSAFDDGKMLEVGFKYLSHGRPRHEPKGYVEWLPVGEDGLDELGNWIQKRHLELYREKGVV